MLNDNYKYSLTNLNLGIKVKLSDKGKDIFYHQYDDLIASGFDITPYFPEEDEDGYTKFQIWRFIELYGKYLTVGSSCAGGTLKTLDVLVEVEKEKRND